MSLAGRASVAVVLVGLAAFAGNWAVHRHGADAERAELDDRDDERDDRDGEEEAVDVVLDGVETAADPAVVKVRRHHGRSGLQICTGTIIAPRFVLTARHCTGSGRMEVVVGDGGGAKVIAVTRTHVDHATGADRHSADIAVLELAQPSSVAPLPVNLDASKAAAVRELRVVGFGKTGSRSDGGERKRTVSAPARVSSEFVESERRGVVCYGDSGGPTLAVIDGREEVVAVTSHMTSTRCESGRVRSVRTDRHRSFLRAFLDPTAPPPPPTTVEPSPPTAPPTARPLPPPRAPQARTKLRPPVLVPPSEPTPPTFPPPRPPWPPLRPGSEAHAEAFARNGHVEARAHARGGSVVVRVENGSVYAHAESSSVE